MLTQCYWITPLLWLLGSAIAWQPDWPSADRHHASAAVVMSSHATASSPTSAKTIFCDLDGVLCDFAHGVRRLFPPSYSNQRRYANNHNLHVDRQEMWERILKHQSKYDVESTSTSAGFFEDLPWTPQGRRLWRALKPLRPHILTGVPQCLYQSRQQKVNWCARELGVPSLQHVDRAFWGRRHLPVPGYRPPLQLTREEHEKDCTSPLKAPQTTDGTYQCRVITCWSDNKHYEAHPGAVLIDDRNELRQKWEEKGGIFVHHNGNVDDTLYELVRLGVLDEDALVEL